MADNMEMTPPNGRSPASGAALQVQPTRMLSDLGDITIPKGFRGDLFLRESFFIAWDVVVASGQRPGPPFPSRSIFWPPEKKMISDSMNSSSPSAKQNPRQNTGHSVQSTDWDNGNLRAFFTLRPSCPAPPLTAAVLSLLVSKLRLLLLSSESLEQVIRVGGLLCGRCVMYWCCVRM